MTTCLAIAITSAATVLGSDPVPPGQYVAKHSSGHAFLLDSDQQLEAIAKPQQLAVMHFTKEGTISTIEVREGDVVEVGQTLVGLANRGPKAAARAAALRANQSAEITMARLAIEQKKLLLSRVAEAMKSHASSPFELESKQADLEQAIAYHQSRLELQASAKMESEIASAELGKYSLSAPFRGIVLQLHSRLGNTINPALPIVTIGNLDTLELEMHLPTHLFGKIQMGAEYRLECTAPVSRDVVVKAAFVSPVLDPTSETFRVRFVMDNRETAFPAGFTARLLAF